MYRSAAEEDDDERRRQKKLEEALEIKSLRRIISAYLNYPEASEEDVKRYEKSFQRLLPRHKELLAHYPQKLQMLRRCISANSYFIFDMLQAFEPPLDMNQDMDICEDRHLENAPNGCCEPFLTSETTCHPKSDQACIGEESSEICVSSKGEATSEVFATDVQVQTDCHLEPTNESDPVGCNEKERAESCCGSEMANCNGNVCSSSHYWLDPSIQFHVPLADVDKVRCIIRNIVRDWAPEGQKERDQCYNPILEELDALFPNRSKESPPACLVPGAGLGRLALEISCLGFISQGNEFSYYMMICSSFILNHAEAAGEWTIYPWIHSNSNLLFDDDQTRPVPIPDIHPASAGITEGFTMCGGDFVEVYGDPNQAGAWDAVMTCFFIDTAHNIVEYIGIISTTLKDGGVWINLGPLLYHFADMYGQEDDMSIELSLEDVKKVALQYGFQLEKEKTVETTYTTNPRSMMQNRYHAAFWTMRKKSSAKENDSTS